MQEVYYLGIDFGTSGARGIVIDEEKTIVTTVQSSFKKIAANKLASNWRGTLDLLQK